MLAAILTLAALGLTYVVVQSNGRKKNETSRRDLAPVRVRSNNAPVIRRRVR